MPYFVAWLGWQCWCSAAASLSAPAQGVELRISKFFHDCEAFCPVWGGRLFVAVRQSEGAGVHEEAGGYGGYGVSSEPDLVHLLP